MTILRVSVAPGEVIRVWHDSDGEISTNRWDWLVSGSAELHPVRVSNMQGIRCAELHMPGLESGTWTVHAPDGSFLSFVWEPFEEYFWLNIRGLPSDSRAVFEPDNDRKERSGGMDSGIVVGGEYFDAREISGVGSRLDVQQLELTADTMQVRLVDLDGYLKSLFACMPQVSTRVLLHYDHEGGGTIVEQDIDLARDQYLWTELGECVRLSGDPVTDDNGVHIMLQRACRDSVQSIIRPGMRLYRYPLLASLFAEVWRWRRGEGSKRLYVGQVSEVVPQASGLQWHLSIRDLISGSNVLRPARGREHPLNVLPWEYQLTAASGMEQTLLETFGPRSINFWRKLLNRWYPSTSIFSSLMEEINFKTCVYFEIQRAEPGAIALDELLTFYGNMYCIQDYQIDPQRRQATLSLWLRRNMQWDFLIIRDCDYLLNENCVDTGSGRYFVVENPGTDRDIRLKIQALGSMFLKREPQPRESMRQTDLQHVWDDRNGFHPFTNSDNEHTLGYWPGKEPVTMIQADDEQLLCTGISRLPCYRVYRSDPLLRPDGYADALCIDNSPQPDDRELMEALPYAYQSYDDGVCGGDLKSALHSLLTGGRDVDGLRPPLRGLGIPPEYVNLSDHPALEALPASGWTDGDSSAAEMMTRFARSSGIVAGVRCDGSIGIAPCLWRPYDSVAISVPMLKIEHAVAPPEVVRIEPPGARELHVTIGQDEYVVCNPTGLGNTVASWEVPAFSLPAAIADNARSVLALVGSARQIVSLRFPGDALERSVGAGDWIRLQGPLPGTLWQGGDAVDCFALIVSASRNLYSGIMELELLLTPEDNPDIRGFHWGSGIEGCEQGYLYLPRDAGVDFGDDHPPGMCAAGLVCRLFDSQQWCDDTFTLSALDRVTFNGVGCYRLAIDAYDDQGAACRALHPVASQPDTGVIGFTGDYARQFRKGLRIFCNDPAVEPAQVTAVEVTGGNTIVQAAWTTAPPLGSLVWSELISLSVATYDSAGAGDYEKSYYFYADPANEAIDTWYAPGAKIWTVTGISRLVDVDGLTVAGDITADMEDASAETPLCLYCSPQRLYGDAPFAVQSATYAEGSDTTTLVLTTTSGTIQTGDVCRDARLGRSWLWHRPGATVAGMRQPFMFSQ